MLASNFFDFEYKGHHELKGKSISIPFFEPINPLIRFAKAATQKLPGWYFL